MCMYLLNCVSGGGEGGIPKLTIIVYKFEKIIELFCFVLFCFVLFFYFQNQYRKNYKIFPILIYIKT